MLHEIHKRATSKTNLYLFLTMIIGFITQIYIVCKIFSEVVF